VIFVGLAEEQVGAGRHADTGRRAQDGGILADKFLL
jgi:hypothetical protein